MMRFYTALLLILLAVAPVLASSPPPDSSSGMGAGRIFLKVDEALALAFPECDIERTTVYLTKAQRKRVEELAGTQLSSGIVHPYVATRKGQFVGTAFMDVHKVRTLRESLFVVVSPQGRVQRLEVLAFAEPLDYLPRGNWFGQFKGKRLDDDLNLDRGIRGVTGATLSGRATTSAVRRSLALQLVLGATPSGAARQNP
jgi:electron transport complex protein RnfG